MASTANPTYKQIAQWADQLPDGVLECRGSGNHAWADRVQEYQRGFGYYFITWTCANGCGCLRHAELDAVGAYMGRPWVVYPEDYLSPLGRITGTGRDAVRGAMIRRSIVRVATQERPPRFKGEYQRVPARRARKTA